MRWILRRMRSDDGIALPIVFGLGLVILVMVGASLSLVSSGTQKTRNDEDWNAALAAAYAGVQEYQSRLANDSTYVQYGNKSATFSQSSAGTLSPPPTANPAFGTGNTWATVPGSDGRAQFRYEVDNSKYAAAGTLRLRSSGKVGRTVRSVVANLKQNGFINYLWFTNFEVQDPLFSGKPECAAYAYSIAGQAARPSTCANIQFASNDVFDGPVHSNDRLVVCPGATFKSPVESAAPSPQWKTGTSCTKSSGSPNWTAPSKQAQNIPIPPTNATDRTQTFSNDPDVTRPGCLYTGPTMITFNKDATMTVVSPWTKQTNPDPSEKVGTGTSLAQCGDINALHTPAGATVPSLDTNLIFVQDVDTDTTKVNGWASGTYPSYGTAQNPIKFTCANNSTYGGWTFGNAAFPMAGEMSPDDSSTDAPAYGCRKGDAFVQNNAAAGSGVGSALTISTDNYIYITGDITYLDKSADMLGLVANKGVIVWNPLSYSNGRYGQLISNTNRTINAAIMSVQHTFQVQNYTDVPLGTLTVKGSIAQNFRGPVGQQSNGTTYGYTKAYSYDPRFLTTAPPKFLTPVSTTYGITQYATVAAAYNADGSSTGR